MTRVYDLVVIGAGTAGLVASTTAAGMGARVALLEADRPGGDCLWTGCVPSKSLIESARLAHAMRNADELGLAAVEPEIDFAAVMARLRSVIEAAGRPDTVEALSGEGVEVVLGRASFLAPGRIAAAGRELRYRTALIATGSRPAVPPIDGIEEAQALTNESVFELDELPARLAVIGGGPIGVELGQAFRRLGSEVELVEAGSRLLPREDPEAAEVVRRALEQEGVRVRTDAHVTEVRPASGGSGALVIEGDELGYDRLLVATGRRPGNMSSLGLERVGVSTTPAGWIAVDGRLRTSADRVYAAGDAVGGPFFTHVAGYHGLLAAANALFRAPVKVDHSAVPAVTFCDPEVASIGVTEAQARESGERPEVFRYDYGRSDRALTMGAARGFVKLVSDRRGRLLGATLVGPEAGETLAEVGRLVTKGGKVADLSRMMHAYPTLSEAPARAADEWWRRRYFTPGGTRLIKALLALLRVIDRPRG